MTYASWSPIAALLGGAAFGAATAVGGMSLLFGVRLRLALREVELRSSAVQARLQAAHIQALADIHEAHRASKQMAMLAIEWEQSRQAHVVPLHAKRHQDEDLPAFADTQPMMFGEFDIPSAVER